MFNKPALDRNPLHFSERSQTTHITAPLLIKQMGDRGSFQGYASVFEELDTQGDRVKPGAFAHSLQKWAEKRRWPKMLWQHNQNEPLGYWKKIFEDPQGLYVEGQLLLDIQKAREAYALIQADILDGLSIGCQIIEAQKGEHPQERILSQIELFEISLVTFAANQKAKIMHVKEKDDPLRIRSLPSSRSYSYLIGQLDTLIHKLQNTRRPPTPFS